MNPWMYATVGFAFIALGLAVGIVALTSALLRRRDQLDDLRHQRDAAVAEALQAHTERRRQHGDLADLHAQHQAVLAELAEAQAAIDAFIPDAYEDLS